jgi:hypothetical protein
VLGAPRPTDSGIAGGVDVSFVFTAISASTDPSALSREDLEYYLMQTSTNTLLQQLNISLLRTNMTAPIASSARLRLVPTTAGVPHVGLLQFRPFPDSDWGTICDDSFTNNEADVMCRALGFVDGATSWSSGKNGGVIGQGYIYVDGMSCKKDGTSLDACTYTYTPPSQPPRHNCVHNEDVTLSCRPRFVPTTTQPTSRPSFTPPPTTTPSPTATNSPRSTPTPPDVTPTPPQPSSSEAPATTASPSGTDGSKAHVEGSTDKCDESGFSSSVRNKFPECTVSAYTCDSTSGKFSFDVSPKACADKIESVPKDEQKKIFGADGFSTKDAGGSDGGGGNTLNLPIIIGCAVGGFIIIALTAFFVYRKRKQAQQQSRNNQRFVDQDYVAMMDYSPPDV